MIYRVKPHEPIDIVINWVWKELLVSSASHGENEVAKSISKALQALGIEHDVFDLFPTKGSKFSFDFHAQCVLF